MPTDNDKYAGFIVTLQLQPTLIQRHVTTVRHNRPALAQDSIITPAVRALHPSERRLAARCRVGAHGARIRGVGGMHRRIHHPRRLRPFARRDRRTAPRAQDLPGGIHRPRHLRPDIPVQAHMPPDHLGEMDCRLHGAPDTAALDLSSSRQSVAAVARKSALRQSLPVFIPWSIFRGDDMLRHNPRRRQAHQPVTPPLGKFPYIHLHRLAAADASEIHLRRHKLQA